jgi:acyl-CoA synthetase (AMP-forming)/AMP-acid ligase II
MAGGNVSCGAGQSGMEIRIDGAGSEPGEIVVRGDAIFAGYFEAPEETSTTLRDGWLHTGDVGYLDDESRLYVLGRNRAMIKRGGGVLAPRELEEAAEEVDGVRLAAAVGVPDRGGGSEAAVVAVEDTRAGSSEAGAVARAVSRAVAAAIGSTPSEVVVLPPHTIPRTENGKVPHARLRELILEGLTGAQPAEAARG